MGRDGNVLVQSRPREGVFDLSREEIFRRLREALEGRGIQQAYVFGSLATGEIHPWSDVDLIIVTATDEPFIERPRRFWDLLDLGFPLDILVYTPDEFRSLLCSDSGFWQTVRKNRVRIV